jgi:hypothetical protein
MPDLDQAHIFSQNGAVPAGATTVSFGTTGSGGAIVCGTVGIINGSSTATLFVQLNGTAATTGTETLALFPGTSYQYVGTPIHSVSIIGSAAAGNYSVVAY